MSLEQEVKFECSDFEGLRRVMAAQHAQYVHRVFEHNRVYDLEDGSLQKEGKLLRLRQAETNVLCLKSPPRNIPEDRKCQVKTWEEIQTRVQDAQNMHTILQGLGYGTAFCYQKVREKWYMGSCAVCLDRLPFGLYVEIEGEPEAIWEQARVLGLDEHSWTAKSYSDLHREWRRKNHLPPQESFVFDPAEQARIQADLARKDWRL
ncbi:MAG: class IV adenylate cyclase [Desulfovermiculus sp.]